MRDAPVHPLHLYRVALWQIRRRAKTPKVPETTPEAVGFVTASLRDRLANRLLQGEIDPDFMEEAPCVRPYCEACLARDSNVEASFGLRA